MQEQREINKKKAIVVSGYFNPIHKGHLELFENAKEFGDFLIVLVNYDDLSLTKYPNVHFVGDALSARGITVSGS